MEDVFILSTKPVWMQRLFEFCNAQMYLDNNICDQGISNFFHFIDCLVQVRAAKGPIFEDGPNFDMAFRLFHGRDGVVPLSERSLKHAEKVEPVPAPPQFNPLAARAATISLSSFGPGGPFGFDSFAGKWKNLNKKSESSKKETSSQVNKFWSPLKRTLLDSSVKYE